MIKRYHPDPWDWTKGLGNRRPGVFDTVAGSYVKGSGGRMRWFYTAESARRYADALNRGCKRPAGYR